MKYNKLLKILDTSFYFCLPSYNPFLNVAKWVFGHIKSHVQREDLQNHRTLLGHINDVIQAVIANMLQDQIREVDRNFGRASHGERLGESCT